MSEWQTMPLSALAESVDYGVTASASRLPIGPKFLRITDIQGGGVDWNTVPWCACDERAARDAQLRAGDIVFARTGATTGKSYLIDECPDNTVFASYLIRVRLGPLAVPRFVRQFFQTPDYWNQISKSARGLAQPGVNATTLKELRVPVPPLSEQLRIADVLDLADELRAARRAARIQLGELTQSIFVDMFGDPGTNPKRWPTATLEDLFDIARGGSPRPIDDYITDDQDGVNWVMIGDTVEGDKYIRRTKKRIRPEGALRSRMVGPGDFLLTNSMSFGRPYIMQTTGCIHDGWLVLSPRRRDAEPNYFYALLGSPGMYAEFARRAAGATVKNLNIDLVRSVQVPVPPLAEQERFAVVTATVEQLMSMSDDSLAETDLLLASLRDRAFAGGL